MSKRFDSDYSTEDILATLFTEEEGVQGAEETHLTFWSLTNGLLNGEPLSSNQLQHLKDCDECIRRVRRLLARHCPDSSSVKMLADLPNGGRLIDEIAEHVLRCDRSCGPEIVTIIKAWKERTSSKSSQPDRSSESCAIRNQPNLLPDAEWLRRAIKSLLTSEYGHWSPLTTDVAPVFMSADAAISSVLTKVEVADILHRHWPSEYNTVGLALVEGVITNSADIATVGGRSKEANKALKKLVEATVIIRVMEHLAIQHMKTSGSWPTPSELTAYLMETDAPRYAAPELLKLVTDNVCDLVSSRPAL